MKIMVAYDGSPCADAALSDLHRAGLPREGQALVMSVAERWLSLGFAAHQVSDSRVIPARVVGAEPGNHLEQANRLAADALARLHSYFTDWKIESVASSGSPAREILVKADELNPDLIVVGCQGHSPIGRFLLGSVAQKVLNEARCSVRVCRGTAWKEGSPVRIVIGLDGSPLSNEAVKVIADRVWPSGSEVRLVTLIDPAKSEQKDSSFGSVQENWVSPFVEAAENKLRAADIGVSSRIEVGDPKHVLVAEADEWGADCIILGATAAASSSASLGGISTAVVARAHCSVEIIRPRLTGDE